MYGVPVTVASRYVTLRYVIIRSSAVDTTCAHTLVRWFVCPCLALHCVGGACVCHSTMGYRRTGLSTKCLSGDAQRATVERQELLSSILKHQ